MLFLTENDIKINKKKQHKLGFNGQIQSPRCKLIEESDVYLRKISKKEESDDNIQFIRVTPSHPRNRLK